ncbi:rab-GTPase-TBC domain-containing protein [Globomyces pollinis-pini]|nr:rab-GTPase-TBC domain-containing protein [Globomyces pollinis-pini]
MHQTDTSRNSNQEQLDSMDSSYVLLSSSEMAEFVLSYPSVSPISLVNNDVVWDNTIEDDTAIGKFEIWSTDSTPAPFKPVRNRPLGICEWTLYFDAKGCLTSNFNDIRLEIFRGGIEEQIRKEVYPFLLDVYSLSSSTLERDRIKVSNRSSYISFLNQWQAELEHQKSTKTTVIQENLFRIEKDVVRTDRIFYDDPSTSTILHQNDPGCIINQNAKLTQLRNILMTYTTSFPFGEPMFVQGMADLASCLLITLEDESDAFWCFVGLMERMKSNFYEDGSGIRRQLHLLKSILLLLDKPLYSKFEELDSLHLFCSFRWLLVLFRREFTLKDCQIIWDACFSDYYGPDTHIFISVAIFQIYRNEIILNIDDGDDLLKFIHSLSMNLSVDRVLAKTEEVILLFQRLKGVQLTVSRSISGYF